MIPTRRGSRWLGAAALISCVWAHVAAAASVKLTFQDGRVWLSANGATVAEILTEWARVGGTQVFNADRVASRPMTLELNGVTEDDALGIVLRATGGYIAAERPTVAGDPHASRMARIAVMAASARPVETPRPADVVPMAPPPPAVAVPRALTVDPSGARRLVGPDGLFVPDDQDGPPAPPPPTPPPATTPAPQTTPSAAVPVIPQGTPRPGMIPPAPPPAGGGRGGIG